MSWNDHWNEMKREKKKNKGCLVLSLVDSMGYPTDHLHFPCAAALGQGQRPSLLCLPSLTRLNMRCLDGLVDEGSSFVEAAGLGGSQLMVVLLLKLKLMSAGISAASSCKKRVM
jgi:hypothetical protein